MKTKQTQAYNLDTILKSQKEMAPMEELDEVYASIKLPCMYESFKSHDEDRKDKMQIMARLLNEQVETKQTRHID